MDFNSIVSYVVAQPWSVAIPFAAAVLADWAIGSLLAWRKGDFKKTSVFNWVQTTVGWKRATAVVSAVALVYFLRGKAEAYLALTPLVAVNAAAFLVVLSDIKDKVVEFVSPAPKAVPAKAP